MLATITNILKETRSEILTRLKREKRLTVEGLASGVGVSKVCIRRHLDLLQRDGLVDFDVVQKSRGRPGHVYFLTDKAEMLFQRGHNRLALSLLKQIKVLFGEAAVSKVLHEQAGDLISSVLSEIEEQDFDSKVKKFGSLMDDRGYDVALHKMGDGSYLLKHCNCPMEAVARNYDQVCKEELRVYREVLRTEVTRECRIAGGAQTCDYRICRPASLACSPKLLDIKQTRAKESTDGGN